ncbi:MAG: GNAT family protein [Pirellulaceae bacterium]|nr:GNAT family protein [Pirellulaceae bacterium]
MLEIHFDSFPTLETERLLLRRITKEDAEALFALRTNPDIIRYLDRDRDKDVAAVMNLIEVMDSSFTSGDGINWGITVRSTPSSPSESNSSPLVGVVGLWRINKANHRGEAGYMLHPRVWGQGIMTEAFQAVLDFGFKVMKLHSVEANTSVANTASQALLLKCGFAKEAHFRENWYYNGRFLDSLIFCKLATDK